MFLSSGMIALISFHNNIHNIYNENPLNKSKQMIPSEKHPDTIKILQ